MIDMSEFNFEKYVTEELKTVWAAIDAQRKITGGLSEKVVLIDYKLDNVQQGVNSIKTSIENLNKASQELATGPDKEKAKWFDMSIASIIKGVITFVIGAIVAYFGLKKGG
jgi:hypothetical protein